MCEKIREGKVMSLSSTNEDDVNDETIIDSDVNDDVVSEIVKKPKKKKRSYKSKKVKSKICKTCNQDILENEISNGLMYKDTYHQMQVKNYCKNHEDTYTNHKCKPHWCGDCDYLINYEITIDHSKWER